MEKKNKKKYDAAYISYVELFPRKLHPQYPPNASEEQKEYITWVTANKDIAAQRSRGVKGPKFRVNPKPVKKEEKWDYYILAIKRL